MRNAADVVHPKVFILGLDGATFHLIKPWVAEGKLPTFKRLLDQGVHGDLRSTIPPVTAPAWSSFMTGKNPGKHGLYHFIEPSPGNYEPRYTNARSRLAKSLWQIMSDGGVSVGVINVPMTYPPEPVDGYMISGMDAPEGSPSIAYPPELYQYLEQKFGKVSKQIRYLGNLKTDPRRDALLEDLKEMDDHYVAVTMDLMERRPVDVVMVVFTSTDTIQHFFWQYMDPTHPQYDSRGAARYGKAILDVYQRIDDILSKFLDALPDECAVVVMSDHGFAPTSARVIRLNRYLADLGLLTFTTASRRWYHPRVLFGSAVRRADAALRGRLTSGQKAKLARWVPGLRKKWESHFTGLANVDWKKTKAYGYEVLTFPPSIWINRKGLRPLGTVDDESEYEETLQFIIEKLYELKDPVTGTQLIQRVYRKEEIYHGPFLDYAPDLTIAWWDHVTLLGKPSFPDSGRASVVEYAGGTPLTGGEWGGGHTMEGILMLWGAPFQEGIRLSKAEIVDLAPTLLYLLGIPIPEDIDGRVLFEAFTDEFAAIHHVSTKKDEFQGRQHGSTYSDDEARMVEERLRGLGYIE